MTGNWQASKPRLSLRRVFFSTSKNVTLEPCRRPFKIANSQKPFAFSMWTGKSRPGTPSRDPEFLHIHRTLTPARLFVSEAMLTTLKKLKNVCAIGFVGGSDLVKQEEQLGKEGTLDLLSGSVS